MEFILAIMQRCLNILIASLCVVLGKDTVGIQVISVDDFLEKTLNNWLPGIFEEQVPQVRPCHRTLEDHVHQGHFFRGAPGNNYLCPAAL